MPDLYFHIKLALELTKECHTPIDEAIVSLGSAGPDPLYYHIFRKNKGIYRSYANSLHHINTKDYLVKMTRYVKVHYSTETYSYLLGFICHYALDVIVHPYIYYHVGVYNPNDLEKKQYKGLHLRFERSLDMLLLEESLGIKARKARITKDLFTIKESPVEINQLMGFILNDRFHIDTGEELFKQSVKSMYRIIKYVNTDRYGLKKMFYSLLDLFSKNASLYYKDLSYYKRDLSFDFLNRDKRDWHHPVTNKVYNSSVIELYDQSKNFARQIIQKVNRYLSGNNDIDRYKVFTNLSFDSGMPCDHKEPLQYFSNYSK